MTETLGVTKDLLAAKTQEVGECEYQWAAAKAKLAQCESDKMEHEADVVHVLEPIVSQIKRLVSMGLFFIFLFLWWDHQCSDIYFFFTFFVLFFYLLF